MDASMYLLVESSYEQCFELFFKTELGYPNFYRVSELLLQDAPSMLTLIAPQDASSAARVEERAHLLSVTYLAFGEGIKTTFVFDPSGKLQTTSSFLEALQKAMGDLMTNTTLPSSKKPTDPTAAVG